MENYNIPFIDRGPYPLREGNRLGPLIGGGPAFRRIGEAIDAPANRVSVTVTFFWQSFEMPDSRGSVFNILDRAAAWGADVRLICWRPDDDTASLLENAFWGSAAHGKFLLKTPWISVTTTQNRSSIANNIKPHN